LPGPRRRRGAEKHRTRTDSETADQLASEDAESKICLAQGQRKLKAMDKRRTSIIEQCQKWCGSSLACFQDDHYCCARGCRCKNWFERKGQEEVQPIALDCWDCNHSGRRAHCQGDDFLSSLRIFCETKTLCRLHLVISFNFDMFWSFDHAGEGRSGWISRGVLRFFLAIHLISNNGFRG
jgi:hypothetical protein